MQTIKQLFRAGVATPVGVRGTALLIQSADQGSNLDVAFMQRGATEYSVSAVGAGFKARPLRGFDGLVITATVDSNVKFIVTEGDIDLQITTQTVTVSNGNGSPVPVKLVASSDTDHIPVDVGGATINVTATNIWTNLGLTVANPVQVAVPVGEPVAVIAADATRRALRIYNSTQYPVAIVETNAGTYANAVLVLNPGDFWNETDAPGAAWWAIGDGTHVPAVSTKR